MTLGKLLQQLTGTQPMSPERKNGSSDTDAYASADRINCAASQRSAPVPSAQQLRNFELEQSGQFSPEFRIR